MVKLWPGFVFVNDTPYLALTGELWGVFHEIFKEKWPRYIESALYKDIILPAHTKPHYGDKMILQSFDLHNGNLNQYSCGGKTSL